MIWPWQAKGKGTATRTPSALGPADVENDEVPGSYNGLGRRGGAEWFNCSPRRLDGVDHARRAGERPSEPV